MLVKGRSNYISLRRLDVAIRAPGFDLPAARGISTSSPRSGSGRADQRRQPLRPRLPAAAVSVWEAVAERERQLPGPRVPEVQGVLLLSGAARMRDANMLVVNHALFVSDLALRASGFGLLPEYDVAILDEAHTLEAVAGEHLGLQLSEPRRRLHAGAAVQRANATRGSLAFTSSTRRSIRCSGHRSDGRRFLRPSRRLVSAPARGLQRPGPEADRPGPRPCSEELRTAGDGDRPTVRRQIEKPRGSDRADRRRGPVPVAGRRDRGLARASGRATPSTGSRWRTRARAADPARRRRRWTSGRACASCCSTRSRPAC